MKQDHLLRGPREGGWTGAMRIPAGLSSGQPGRGLTALMAPAVCLWLAGCGGTTNGEIEMLPPTPLAALPAGYFTGAVTNSTEEHWSTALLTADGEARVFIGAVWKNVQTAAQFVGRVRVDAGDVVGEGTILGVCYDGTLNRFCGTPAPATIRLTAHTPYYLSGEIELTTIEGDEVWLLELGWPPTQSFVEPATLESIAGIYGVDYWAWEEGSTFPFGAIVSVDGAGQLFFQGPDAGCTGNGTFSPHLGAAGSVFDVALTIMGCDIPWQHLNGEFDGLATHSFGPGWGDFLLLWLSTPEGSPAPSANLIFWDRE